MAKPTNKHGRPVHGVHRAPPTRVNVGLERTHLAGAVHWACYAMLNGYTWRAPCPPPPPSFAP